MFVDPKTRVLKWIDHWCGTPICILCNLFDKLRHPFRSIYDHVGQNETVRSVLVMKFFGLGSITLSYSLLRHLKAQYPNAKIVCITFTHNVDLVRRLEIVDEIRTIDVRNGFYFLRSLIAHLTYLWTHTFDIAIDLEYFSKFSTLLLYGSGARFRIGFHLPQIWRMPLVNIPVYFNQSRHIVNIYGMVAKAAGCGEYIYQPAQIRIDPKEVYMVQKIIENLGIGKNSLCIGVNLNASDLALCRKWPIENYAQVIHGILQKYDNACIILTGNQSEVLYTESVFNWLESGDSSRVFSLAGKLSFGEFLALLKRCNVFVTNDSGPYHLSRAQKTPTVSIWGPGSPKMYGPYPEDDRSDSVVWLEWSCCPCLYVYRTPAGYYCQGETPCLKKITSNDVFARVDQMIAEN